jgi:endonuclease/exonuclease/phosphatase family metal-dependent hydrolase
MIYRRRSPAGWPAVLGLALVLLGQASAQPVAYPAVPPPIPDEAGLVALRIATFNAALSGPTRADLAARLESGQDPKLKRVAALIQSVRPAVLLLNEFDHDPDHPEAQQPLVERFQKNYLAVPQFGNQPIRYAHSLSPRVNTGEATGLDLDGDGRTDGPGDAHGWGEFPGQYGMVLLSRYPLGPTNQAQDERTRLWTDFPFHFFPGEFYPEAARRTLRLSSKPHRLVPLNVNGRPIGIVISHPTPPVFDGPEDRNGKRNFDEIGLVNLIVNRADRPVVVLGDLNADPNDGASLPGAIDQLLTNPKLQDPRPRSEGAVAAAERDGGMNTKHKTDAALDTADWNDDAGKGPGNLRVDYVLPSVEWKVLQAGVFWPRSGERGHEWTHASDHRLVWVDLSLAMPRAANPRRAPH